MWNSAAVPDKKAVLVPPYKGEIANECKSCRTHNWLSVPERHLAEFSLKYYSMRNDNEQDLGSKMYLYAKQRVYTQLFCSLADHCERYKHEKETTTHLLT